MSTDSSSGRPFKFSSEAPVPPKAPGKKQGGINWSPVAAVVFVIAVYFIAQVVASLLISIYALERHFSQAAARDWVNNSIWAQFFYVLIAEGLTLGAIYLFLKWRGVSWRAIGWRRPKWSDPGWGLAVLPAYYVLYVVLVVVVHALVPSLNVDQAQQIGFNNISGFGPLLVAFISLVILPPFTEEVLVRGYLYTSLRKGMPQMAAVLVTSVIFASAHLQAGSGAPLLWIAFLDTFVLSLFLIFLREKTDGLWASMTLHGSKNLIAFLTLFIFHLH